MKPRKALAAAWMVSIAALCATPVVGASTAPPVPDPQVQLGSAPSLSPPTAITPPSALMWPAPEVTPRAALAPTMVIDNASRDSVRNAFQQWFKSAHLVPVDWNGNAATCNAGAPSTAGQNATLSMINYIREMVKVDPVTFSADLSSKAQQAALIMEANGQLSHSPPESWRCWNQIGSDAADKSNLSLGGTGAIAVLRYMTDGGSNNLAVGHRRWVTAPNRTLMGSGSTRNANALYVITPADPGAKVPAMIAWPTPGYFPSTLEPYGRWSFNIPSGSLGDPFVNAQVTVRETTGKGHQVDIVDKSCCYGMGYSMTFQVQGIENRSGYMDRTYRVTITGIDHPTFPSEYTYYVTLFDPETATPPLKDPPPPTRVVGNVEGIKATGNKVSFYGWAYAIVGEANVVITRDGKTLGTIKATRPRSDGYKGWLYEPTDTPGTHTYCAQFPNNMDSSGPTTVCRNVVVK